MESETRRGRGRGRSRGRRKGRGRGRGGVGRATSPRRKKLIVETEEDSDDVPGSPEKPKSPELLQSPEKPESGEKNAVEKAESEQEFVSHFCMDDDITQLIPPTFSTLSNKPPQPMLELQWNQEYRPIGDKVPNPNIHMCAGCILPIRIYGRLIPCKHVYCHNCATDLQHCSSCNDKVHRIEKAALGSVFMCYHEGERYGLNGCRRTYLSQRDLQAHIDHRHKPKPEKAPPIAREPKEHKSSRRPSLSGHTSQYPSPGSKIPPAPVSYRNNLISVPIMQHASSRDFSDDPHISHSIKGDSTPHMDSRSIYGRGSKHRGYR